MIISTSLVVDTRALNLDPSFEELRITFLKGVLYFGTDFVRQSSLKW